MGALFPGVRVQVGERQGVYIRTVRGEVNGVSGAVYPIEYHLVKLDEYPDMLVAVLLKDLKFPT
jgi:hypothetical protein